MNAAMPVAWIFMLFMVLIVFGALAAIIWRSWVVGGIVLVFFVLVFGLYFVRIKAVETPAQTMVVLREAQSSPHSQLDSELLKNAEVYPSTEEAAKYLALRLLDQIEQNRPADAPRQIHIVTRAKDRVSEGVEQVLNGKYPAANIIVDDIHASQTVELMLTLQTDNSTKTGKCLTFSAEWDQRKYSAVQACVKEAPWAADLDAYRLAHPGREFVVGWSTGPESSIDNAKQQARADAVNQMLPFVFEKFPILGQPNQSQWLRAKLENELNKRKFSTEEFVQALHLSTTGDKVYRVAVLAEVSAPQLAGLNRSIVPEFHRRNDSVRHFSLGTMGLGVVICIVYLFLNWATRGYFQMNLRLGAFLVLIAGVLVLLTISSWPML